MQYSAVAFWKQKIQRKMHNHTISQNIPNFSCTLYVYVKTYTTKLAVSTDTEMTYVYCNIYLNMNHIHSI